MNELLSAGDASSPALIDADRGVTVTYAELRGRVAEAAGALSTGAGPGLVFLRTTNTIDGIVAYLAGLAAGRPLALLDAALPEPMLAALAETYRPAAVMGPEGIVARPGASAPPPHPDLALLLTTSGSTGNPKLVRLTARNLLANASSIGRYLGLTPAERGMLSLPVQYSYGLSVLNSHLLAGAAVVISSHSFMRPEFWQALDRTAATSFAGVPYAWETLHRLRFDPARHPTLRTMTQAGGALKPELIRAFHERASAAGRRFFVMYGQTEATARIAYVPPERLADKIGSIGIAIPDGELSLQPVDGSDQSELVYRGPNVMMGYAHSADDLADGDRLGGVLRTGDLAQVDDDGYFRITGRLARFAKLFGRRVSLEDVERELERQFPLQAAAVEDGERLLLHVAPTGDAAVSEAPQLLRHVATWLAVPPTALRVQAHARLPMTASGKKDYQALRT